VGGTRARGEGVVATAALGDGRAALGGAAIAQALRPAAQAMASGAIRRFISEQ
jgi:hypothetical protein